MNGDTTVSISLLLLILSSLAQWANIYYNNKRLKESVAVANKDRLTSHSECAASTDMVSAHISLLATHTAELASIKANLTSIDRKLDNIQNLLMRPQREG
jgi:hypothetical protein